MEKIEFGFPEIEKKEDEDEDLQAKLEAEREKLREKYYNDELARAYALRLRRNLEKRMNLIWEQMNLSDAMKLWLNILYQQKLLDKEEASFYAGEIANTSKGRDNFTTMAILKALTEADLFAKEELVEKDFPQK